MMLDENCNIKHGDVGQQTRACCTRICCCTFTGLQQLHACREIIVMTHSPRSWAAAARVSPPRRCPPARPGG